MTRKKESRGEGRLVTHSRGWFEIGKGAWLIYCYRAQPSVADW